MKTMSFTYTTRVDFSEPVSQHDFVLRCLPASTDWQLVRATLELQPETPFDVQQDNFGNKLAVGTIREEHTSFTYTVSGTAKIDFTRKKQTEAHPLMLRETKRTAMTPEIREFLADSAASGMHDMVLGGMGAQGTVTFICEHLMHMVHNALEYRPGSTTVSTTAAEAFDQRAGVCQDYAHLLITLFRATNVPARYVSGLVAGEGSTHAWVEALIDGLWIGFDPTHDVMVDESYIMLASGRDWADCPIERGTFQGLARQIQTVRAVVTEQ